MFAHQDVTLIMQEGATGLNLLEVIRILHRSDRLIARLFTPDQYLALEYNRPDFPPDRFGFDYADHLNFASATTRYIRDGLVLLRDFALLGDFE